MEIRGGRFKFEFCVVRPPVRGTIYKKWYVPRSRSDKGNKVPPHWWNGIRSTTEGVLMDTKRNTAAIYRPGASTQGLKQELKTEPHD